MNEKQFLVAHKLQLLGIRQDGLRCLEPDRCGLLGILAQLVEEFDVFADQLVGNAVSIRNDADFRIDIDALREQIQRDRNAGLQPFCVVGNAGTVNTGAIDPLNELAGLCEESGMWLHVDGAYGGLAAALESHRGAYAGIERAHSIALDFHKWFHCHQK